ncbi:MAG: ATP-grasp domain-containing protein [Candidatus Staskawiczbacteria bacterium]|nr:ATP-grasp domain-containing protein [Candidatus Staskawiczbacteria bacterium]
MKKKTAGDKTKSINILFTSVGNKISLIKSFKKAFHDLKMPGKTIGVDSDAFSAGLYIADKGYVVPSFESSHFFEKLVKICLKEKVSAVVPTRDEDLLFFSKYKNKFDGVGIKILVSSFEPVSICADKWKFYLYLKKVGLPAIETWKEINSKIGFPCIVKPRSGKGGVGALIVNSKKELSGLNLKEQIIQEKIEGVEYTVDYFADFNAQPICIIPRIRFKIAGGESKVGITKNEKNIVSLTKKLAQSLNLIGHNTIQCFKLKDGSIKFLEVNPRFGGGASLGVAAGCKSPEYIVSLLAGYKVKPVQKFIEDLVMIRYSNDIFLPYDKINNL